MQKEVVEVATRENLLVILKEVSRKMNAVKVKLIDEYGIYFSNKNLSEIIGKIIEKTASEYFTNKLGYEVKNALTDKEPDLLFTQKDLSIEIKVTSTKNAWTGGEFSKRPFHYLLVSWGGGFDEFFVCAVKLAKKDWKSNISSNYYGPSLSIKKLNSLKDKLIVVGSIDNENRMVREKV